MTKYRYAQRKGKYVGKIDKLSDGVRLNNFNSDEQSDSVTLMEE